MSMGTFSYRPQARIDISESAEYIAQDSPDVAVAFVRAVADTCRALAEMPEMGVQRDYENPALLEARMMPVRGYHKYLIFIFRIITTILMCCAYYTAPVTYPRYWEHKAPTIK